MTPIDDSRVIDLTIRISILALFIYLTLTLVAPLFGLILWAIILTVAVAPLHIVLSRWLGGRQKLSAGVLTLLGLLITLGPVALLGAGIVEAGYTVNDLIQQDKFHMPPPPEALKTWPMVGPWLHETWGQAHLDLKAVAGRFSPQILKVAEVALNKLAGVGFGLVTMSLAVLIMGALLVTGQAFVRGARLAAARIFSDNGVELINLAGATVRNVSRGVIGVAVIQALLAGVIMAAFGIDAAGPLALAILLLAIIQVGAGPVLLPVVIWAWVVMPVPQALLFTVVIAPVTVIDNILKPIFLARGLETPMLVILIGVLGGLMAHGLIGIFVGPVVLAVFYELFTFWLGNHIDAADAAADPDAPE